MSRDRIKAAGLSPRVRGNPPPGAKCAGRMGSIPACAGEPDVHCHPVQDAGVYPRVCGGTVEGGAQAAGVVGLSPRVRGNPARTATAGTSPGSIPACAGEPNPRRCPSSGGGVYPRVCGGTPPPDCRNCPPAGLSPRVRGNRGWTLRCTPIQGSIPACAGEPPGYLMMPDDQSVYPRVCGGTSCADSQTAHWGGLSPRVRGNQQRGVNLPAIGRSIPACAGEPPPVLLGNLDVQVYPRVCGGTDGCAGEPFIYAGLSPRVRGNLPRPPGG